MNPANGPSRRPNYLEGAEEVDDTPISRLIPALLNRVVGNRGKAAESRDLSGPRPSMEAQADQWAARLYKSHESDHHEVPSGEGILKVTSS